MVPTRSASYWGKRLRAQRCGQNTEEYLGPVTRGAVWRALGRHVRP